MDLKHYLDQVKIKEKKRYRYYSEPYRELYVESDEGYSFKPTDNRKIKSR